MNAAFDPPRITQVRVTNNTKEAYTDRYDGVPVTLAPGQSDVIPLEMAAHFFGYHAGVRPEQMLNHICNRRGGAAANPQWKDIYSADQTLRRKLAEDFFKDFKIEPVVYKLVEDVPPPDLPVPARADEDEDDRGHEPTAVKELAKAGIKRPDDEPPPAPGRGHPRRDTQGRRRE